MSFLQVLVASVKGSFPGLLYWLVFPMVPFMIAEQLRPVATAPRLRDYWTNLLISVSTAYLSPEHHDKNFADALPIFDIVFGTFERPKREEFPPTGLGPQSSPPRSLLAAQFGPLLAVGGLLRSFWLGTLRPRRASG